MIINRIEKLPNGFDRYESESFDKYDLSNIPENIVEIFYWYGRGDYCGVGHLLMRDDNSLWHHHKCDHCSCYGPTNDFTLSLGEGKPLENLFDGYSKGLMAELSVILEDVKFKKLLEAAQK